MPGPVVLHVASERHPLVKTGGLADVVGALPAAQRRAGVDARVLLPGYPRVLAAATRVTEIARGPTLPGGTSGRLLELTLRDAEVPTYALEAAALYDRPGGPYTDEHGTEHPDNAERFAALGWAARVLTDHPHRALRADLLHGHDWQAGLAIAQEKLLGRGAPTVATIHNIAYAGAFPRDRLEGLGLPPGAFSMHGVEFYGRVSFLKAALYYADRITTVSPTYAREITTEAEGGGFEGLLAARAGELSGILNGIDEREWDPATDPHLTAHYGLRSLDGKRQAQRDLRRELGLREAASSPLFGVVSRLAWQKGLDLLLEAAPHLIARGGDLALLGSGDPGLAADLTALAAAHPGRVAFVDGYDERLAHRIQAGSDHLVVPSRSEPCGLVQLYALRYGSPPVVRRTGGLADTVVDATADALAAGRATGFVFEDATVEALTGALDRAMDLHAAPDALAELRRAGMRSSFGWHRAAKEYAALYRTLLR